MPALIKRISSLRNEGPTIEVIIFPPAPIINAATAAGQIIPQVKGIGLIDTGASMSAIDANIATNLQLISRDYVPVLTPSGISNHYTYDIAVMLPAQLGLKMFFIEVTGADLSLQPYDFLIGRDILEQCTLIFNGWDNSFQLHI